MSVIWQLDAHTLAVRDVWFGRTIIRSSYQLHYELAQALLNGEPAEVPELAALGPEEKDAKLAKLTQALEMLTQVARHLRAHRDRGGALELEGMEVRSNRHNKARSNTYLTPPFPSGTSPAGQRQEHHSPGPPAAPGGPRDRGRVHDLRQPLGGAQDPGGLPPSGPAEAPPATSPGVLQPAGGQRHGQGLHHQHKVTGSRGRGHLLGWGY